MPIRCSLLFAIAWVALAGSLCRGDEPRRPLKVVILVGQSNMQGHAHLRTLQHLAMAPETTPTLESIQNADGTPRVHEGVWISYLTDRGEKHGLLSTGYGADDNKIGPELTLGIALRQAWGEPILLIKTAWGGKSLNTDFRPPSGGPYEFTAAQLEQFRKQGRDVAALQAEKAQATGRSYRLMLDHVRGVLADIRQVVPDYDPAAGYELAGFVWFQGWNDLVDSGTYPLRDQAGGFDEYSRLMAHFIRDVRRDLAAPKLPFVIGVLGVGGPVDDFPADEQRYQTTHRNFRLAMAAPANTPEFQGNVAAVLTEQCWDSELSGLVKRDEQLRHKIRQETKGQQLKPEQIKQMEADARAREFSARELELLDKGISNAAYHYLGSAKILTCIGQRLAAALLELQPKTP